MAADRTDRLRPVRWRTTGIAVVVAGVALVVAGVALLATLRHTMTVQVREDAALRAQEIAATLAAGGAPDLEVGDPEDAMIQVVRTDGTVAAASANIAGRPAVADLAAGDSEVVDPPLGKGDYIAVAVPVRGPSGDTVIVGRSLDDVAETTRIVTLALLIGVPLVLLVVGATTWRLVGPVLARAARAERRRRQFVSDASHELRSPIAAIRQHAEVAAAYPDRVAADELARPVLAEAIRLQEMVDDMLLLARVDERALHLKRRPVDLDDLVLDEIRRLRRATALRIDGSGVGAGRVEGDPRMLLRVLRNAGDNAARHARTTVGFAVSSSRPGWVDVAIDDDGPGIAPADRERVFERFVRLDQARSRDGGGSGLGLAIVTEVIRAHGGTVQLHDSPLGGARLRIRLPTDGFA